MPYRQPVYNLTIAIWHAPAVPPIGPPDVVVDGNLAWGRRVATPTTGGTGSVGVPMFTMTLLLPAATNIWGDPTFADACIVEAPIATGRYYICLYVDDLGKGFANEHRGAILLQALPWPHPIP